MSLLPASGLPKLSHASFLHIRSRLGLKGFYVLGWRGYFDQMGEPGNGRRVYDDAAFAGDDDTFEVFNMNTDPNGWRKGHGTGSSMGMASLLEGVYDYRVGPHYGASRTVNPACRQAGAVYVLRDADSSVPEKDIILLDGIRCYKARLESSINHHPAGNSTTSSLGCQTFPPEQWERYIGTVQKLLAKHKQPTFKYALIASGKLLA